MAKEQARQLAERVATLEAELQATLQANAKLMRGLQEQCEVAETAQLRADRRGRAQMQDFANLAAEIIAGRRGLEVQMENVRIGVKMERPDYFYGSKDQDVDTWLFQVHEHLDITVIPKCGQVPYAISLFRGNAPFWWREICEDNNRPGNWNDFCCAMRAQFRVENLSRRGRDELASMYQYGKESVADFLYRFRATCLKVDNLSEAKKLDRFVCAVVPDVRMQVELRGPGTFHGAAMYAERANAVLLRVTGHDAQKHWQKKQKSHFQQRPLSSAPKIEGESSVGLGPEPMEIGSMRHKSLSKEEYQRLHVENACFYCKKLHAGHMVRDCPLKKKK